MATEEYCNLLQLQVDLSHEWQSENSSAHSDEHLPK